MAYNEDPKYNQGGYNPNAYNQGGYNPNAYNQGGYNQGGYNPNGANQGGYNPNGYNNGYNGGGMPPRPSNYLVFSILVTIFCCLPFGIAAIIYSVQTDSAYNAGDYDGALRNSNKAKTWCIVSVVVSLVLNLIGFIFYGAALYASLLDI